MKHFYKALLLFGTLFSINTLAVEAQNVTIDGLNYEIADGSATLTGPVDKELTEFIIPDAIEYDGSSYPVTSISFNAFLNCPNFTEVTIPQSVANIGAYAFSGVDALKTVNIADGDSELTFGGAVFYGSPIETVYFGRTLASNSQKPFGSISTLANLTIGEQVTAIGYQAFRKCSNLAEVTIPQSVTSIDGYAFSDCNALKTVTIADGDRELIFGNNVFDETPIETVHLGRNLASTSKRPFENSATLSTLTIGNQVTTIGNQAFSNCTSLTEVIIPQSVVMIDEFAFTKCSALKTVTIADGDNELTSRGSVFIECPIETVYYGRNFVANSQQPFSGISTLTNLTIGNQVTAIGKQAFSGCTGLAEVIIPQSVTSIGNNAFSGCEGLVEVIIPQSVASIGDFAFQSCSNLANLTISQSVATIGNYAFASCSKLAEVTIPQSVTRIGDFAFFGCSALKSVTITDGDSELTFNGYVFSGCPIETVYLGRNFSGSPYQNSTSIKNLTIGDSATSIPNNAFSGCSALTDVIFADSEGELNFGTNVFNSCPIEKVYLGRNLAESSQMPFQGNTTLTALTIGNQVSTIGTRAFRDCSSLVEVTIPQSVTSIGQSAFDGCATLAELTIPQSVATINDSAFYRCSALKTVTIADGDSDLNFGSSVFDSCPIETLYLGRNPVADFLRPFSGIRTLTNLTIGNQVTTIGFQEFQLCSSLAELTIPSSVTSIDGYAFRLCSGLKTVTIADGDTELTFSDYVFNGCPVETVYLGRNLAGSSDFPFRNSTQLNELTIGTQVTAIGAQAFKGCSGLNEIACEPLTPPSAESDSFDETTYTSATMSVPEEAKASYLSDPVWRKFKSIHILVESITLDPEAFKGKPGDSFLIKATVLPADATNPTIEWSSSNDIIASVDQDGTVTLNSEGYCEITAKATDGSEAEAICVIDILTGAELIGIDNEADIEVYNLEGALIARSLKRLPAGFYITKQGSTVAKIRI